MRALLCLVGLLPLLCGAEARDTGARAAEIRADLGLEPGETIQKKVCIWDIAGRAGPIFQAAQDQRTRVLQYGIDIELVPYTNEGVMVEALKSERCDAALMTGLRARLFNKFTGTIDSIGGMPSIEHMRVLLKVLADPRMADKMVSGQYEILGIAPGGAAYVFVNDRAINTLANAAGKKVAVLDYDETQAEMVAQVGATPVRTDLVSAPNKFNNGVVDVIAAPLVAYEVLELYKGMSPDGGIIDYPLAQITMQLVGRDERFPDRVAQIVREEFYGGFDEIVGQLHSYASKVPDHWWIEIPPADKQEYETMMQEARIQLRTDGYYSGDMLKLQRKIRCKFDSSRPECTQNVE